MVCLIVPILVGVWTTLALRGAHAAPMTGEENIVIDPVNQPQAAVVQRKDVSQFTDVLQWLKEIGRDQLAVENGRKRKRKQYIVISVFSSEEFHQNRSAIPQNRTKFILNRKTLNQPAYLSRAEVHGEIQALHLDYTIDIFLGQLGTRQVSNVRDLPYVFVYSYYIPCAGLRYITYSCAEELANTARVNRGKYKMIVGFTTEWRDTDLNMAIRYLKEGGIYSLINITSGQEIQGTYTIENLQIYQKSMSDCMKNRARITDPNYAAYLVNSVTKHCTETIAVYGYMTQYGKTRMDECLNEFVAYNGIGRHLRGCSAETLSWHIRMMLGKPTSICNDAWRETPEDLRWINLYSNTEQFQRSVPYPTFESDYLKIRRLCKDIAVGKMLQRASAYMERTNAGPSRVGTSRTNERP